MAPAIADPELGDAIDLAPKSQIELLTNTRKPLIIFGILIYTRPHEKSGLSPLFAFWAPIMAGSGLSIICLSIFSLPQWKNPQELTQVKKCGTTMWYLRDHSAGLPMMMSHGLLTLTPVGSSKSDNDRVFKIRP